VGGKRRPRGAPRLRSAVADVSGEGSGVVLGRHPAELRVWPAFVVVAPPGFEHGAGKRSGAKWSQADRRHRQVIRSGRPRPVSPERPSVAPGREQKEGSHANHEGEYANHEPEVDGAPVCARIDPSRPVSMLPCPKRRPQAIQSDNYGNKSHQDRHDQGRPTARRGVAAGMLSTPGRR
jgi:hypothetical protein